MPRPLIGLARTGTTGLREKAETSARVFVLNARGAADKTQREAAEILACDPETIGRAERGETAVPGWMIVGWRLYLASVGIPVPEESFGYRKHGSGTFPAVSLPGGKSRVA